MTMIQNGAVMLTPPHLPKRDRYSSWRSWKTGAYLACSILLALILAWAGTIAPVGQSDILGNWVSVNDGTTTSLEFKSDGSVHVADLQSKDQLLTFDGTWSVMPSGVVVNTNDAIEGSDWSILLPTHRSLFKTQLSNYPEPTSHVGVQTFSRR